MAGGDDLAADAVRAAADAADSGFLVGGAVADETAAAPASGTLGGTETAAPCCDGGCGVAECAAEVAGTATPVLPVTSRGAGPWLGRTSRKSASPIPTSPPSASKGQRGCRATFGSASSLADTPTSPVARESVVPQWILGQVNFPEAALAQQPDDAVIAKNSASLQRHALADSMLPRAAVRTRGFQESVRLPCDLARCSGIQQAPPPAVIQG